MRVWIKTFLIGLFMGTADAVPGVSGGTIALIAGIYKRLIAAITAITPHQFLNVIAAITPLNGGISTGRVASTMDEVDGYFLITLVTGIATAIVLVGQGVEWANTHYPVLMFGLFFGLIGMSALILLRAIEISKPTEGIAALFGVVVAFVVSGSSDAIFSTGGFLGIFIAGAVAVSAMILPGLSGSLLLVILGQYTYMYERLGAFLDGIGAQFSGGQLSQLISPGLDVATFVLGGLIGLVTIARVIRKALENNREVTFAFLVALVLGALRAPVTTLNGGEYDVVWNTPTIEAFAGAALLGGSIIYIIDWYTVEIDLASV